MSRLVVAVALGLVLVGCSEPTRTSPAAGPPPSVPARTATPTAEPDPLGALPVGPPPRVGYAVRDVFVAPDGERTDLAAIPAPLFGVAVGPAGLLVTDGRVFEGSAGLWLVSGDGSENLGPACTSGSGATTGQSVAWASYACPESGVPAPTTLHLRTPTGQRTQVIETRPDSNARTTVHGLVDGDLVFSRGFIEGAFVTDLAHRPRRVPGPVGVSAVDADAGLLAGPLSVGEGVTVVDLRPGRRLWTDPRAYGVDFSPDGARLLVATPRSWVVVTARTGKRVVEIDRPDGVRLWDVVWEDDGHLLAVAQARRRTAIVRLGLDGTVERVTPPLRERPLRTGYLLDGAG